MSDETFGTIVGLTVAAFAVVIAVAMSALFGWGMFASPDQGSSQWATYEYQEEACASFNDSPTALITSWLEDRSIDQVDSLIIMLSEEC